MTPRPSRLLMISLGLLLLHEILLYGRVVDDAWITFRYARNLVEGHGLVFNIGERVEGYTNFLFALIQAAMIAVGLPVESGTKILGMAASLATLVVVHEMGRRVFGKESPWAAAAPLLLAVNPPFAQAAVTGLETSLYAFFIALGLKLAIDEMESRPLLSRSALCLGFAALTRPDGLLFGAVVFGHRLLWRLDRRDLKPRDLLWIAGFLIPVAPHFLFRWLYYGAIVPNTFAAKAGGFHPTIFYLGFQYVWGWANYFGGMALFGAAFLCLARGRTFANTLFALVTVVYLAYVMYTGGDWMPQFRFIAPILPVVVLMLAQGVESIWRSWLSARDHNELGVRLAVGFTLAAFLVPQFVDTAQLAYMAHRDRGMEGERLRRMRTLEALAGPDDAIALTPIGLVGWETRRPIVDLAGLTDRELARNVNVDYVYAKNPAVLVLGSRRDGTSGDLDPAWRQDAAVAADARFQEYRFVESWAPWRPSPRAAVLLATPGVAEVGGAAGGAYWLNVYVRKDLSR